MNWTDKTTSRGETLVENFFGEGIMLHQQNLLGDVIRNRPVIVKYQSPVNYVVEACIVLLFVLGILAGRKSKFLWLTMTFLLTDAALHIGWLRHQRGLHHDGTLYVCPSYRHRLPGAQGKRKEHQMGIQRIDARHHPLSLDKQWLSASELHARIRSLNHKKLLSKRSLDPMDDILMLHIKLTGKEAVALLQLLFVC